MISLDSLEPLDTPIPLALFLAKLQITVSSKGTSVPSTKCLVDPRVATDGQKGETEKPAGRQVWKSEVSVHMLKCCLQEPTIVFKQYVPSFLMQLSDDFRSCADQAAPKGCARQGRGR